MKHKRLFAGWCLAHIVVQAGGLDLGRASMLARTTVAPHSCGWHTAAFVGGAVRLQGRGGVLSHSCGQSLHTREVRNRQRGPALGARMCGDGNRREGDSNNKLVRAVDGWLDKLERKSQKKYDNIVAKTQRLKARAGRLSEALSSVPDERGLDRERKRDRLRRLWLLAVSSPAYIVMTVTVLAFAGPALMAAFGATIGLLTFVALLLQIFLITLAPAGMLLLAGGTLMAPMLTSVASSTLMLATLVAMLIVCNVPRARSLPGLTIATLVPAANLWLASQPVHTLEVVKSMRVFDPLSPLVTDPMFRPLLPDLFLSDFLDLVPNPFLMVGIAAYYWYQERAAVRQQLSPLLQAFAGSSSTSSTSSSWETGGGRDALEDGPRDLTREMEGVREDLQEMATQELQQWDTSFKLRPAPSGQPKDWSVEDLCLVLQEQGLADSVDSVRRCGIDGRVALTLTPADEADLRSELGINKLGERKRLLLLFQDMRAMQRAAEVALQTSSIAVKRDAASDATDSNDLSNDLGNTSATPAADFKGSI
eukprot:CAMPEP_0173129046 /NCGR_PEP_ID=MMETSP1102-20130122/58921_1 /TAXON_ID=49646 /ORGANISM="Geminigera sp., Strain Caron Lab Isolate" /LENGTH=535 /DNA_ID=CAMNT_0014039315 /DNA_START=22 /DNA_END=1630 /DNA_ORIENTATION=+